MRYNGVSRGYTMFIFHL